MDLNSLSNFIDVRAVSSMVNKVKNAVYNYTEFEIKVRDATNNEPWGASSTLMQEIAAGTHNYGHFTEIMETIYLRFQEKSGPQWRQVYKALQLLEYLIKNGAERVIDSARDHIYELKALKNFHYVDDKQKDQGINVRNRANEIQELLANNDKIKEERRKAKENRNKYTGVSSDGTGSFGGSKYGGFGSESFRSGGFREDSRPATPVRRESESSSRGYDSHGVSSTSTGTTDKGKISIKMTGSSAAAPSAQPQPAANLLDIDSKGDDWGDFTSAPSAPAGSSAAAGRTSGFGDFADFQSAPASAAPPTNFASFPTPGSAHPSASGSGQNSGFANFANFSAPVASQTTIAQPSATGMDLLGDLGGSGGGSTGGGFGAFAGFGGAAMSAPLSANGTASTPIKPKSDDPFSKLVSLDASSLSSTAKKEETTGPSLNSIGWSTPSTPGAGSSSFGQFATASGSGISGGASGFGYFGGGTMTGQQQPQRPMAAGFGGAQQQGQGQSGFQMGQEPLI